MPNFSLLLSALVAALLVVGANGSACAKFAHRMFHVKVEFPDFKPFYSLLVLGDAGTFSETINVADGNNSAHVGVSLAFNVHQGFYSCSQNRVVKLTNIGYIYRTKNVPALKENGALGIHQYVLRFPLAMNHNRCHGEFQLGYYSVDSNPFDGETRPLSKSGVANLTCVQFKGRNFAWPQWKVVKTFFFFRDFLITIEVLLEEDNKQSFKAFSFFFFLFSVPKNNLPKKVKGDDVESIVCRQCMSKYGHRAFL